MSPRLGDRRLAAIDRRRPSVRPRNEKNMAMKTLPTSYLEDGLFETVHGTAGRTYVARECSFGAPPAGGGIYMIVDRRTRITGPQAFYIGKAPDLPASLVPSHEKMSEAILRGATHLLIIPCADKRRRTAIKADLIAFYQPPLNRQRRPLLSLVR